MADELRHARRVLEALRRQVRPMMAGRWHERSCIATVRICALVCRNLGLSVRPQAARVMIFNARYVQLLAQTAGSPDAEQIRACLADGGHTIGLGIAPGDLRGAEHAPAPGDWAGHLVLLAPAASPRLMLDASLDQAARPRHELPLSGLVAGVARRSRSSGVLVVDGPAGSLLRYEFDDSDRAYLTAPDWTDLDRHRRIVAQLTARLRAVT